MQTLSIKMIKKYDYIKVREYVEDELYNLKILGTRLMCLLPPDAGRHINTLDKVDGSYSHESKLEKYVEKKEYIEKELEKEMIKHSDSFAIMNNEEITVLKEEFIYQNTMSDMEEKYGWSLEKIKHLKKSYMIKYALSNGKYFEK